MLNRATAGKAFELPRGIVRIGRADDNDLRITAAAVSSYHCELRVSELDVRVKDLGSTNGTYIDRQPIDQSAIRDGQVLAIGSVELKLEFPEPEVRIPERHREEEPRPTFLADGRPACLRHPGKPADYGCGQCGKHWCAECVKALGVAGGTVRRFCPDCSGPCRQSAPAPAARKRKTRVDRVWDTIKLGFTWRTPKR